MDEEPLKKEDVFQADELRPYLEVVGRIKLALAIEDFKARLVEEIGEFAESRMCATTEHQIHDIIDECLSESFPAVEEDVDVDERCGCDFEYKETVAGLKRIVNLDVSECDIHGYDAGWTS